MMRSFQYARAARRTCAALGAAALGALAFVGCAGPNGELPRLDAATQTSAPGSGYGVQGGYIGTSGAFTSLGTR